MNEKPVMAAIARGYVAEDASASTV